MNGSQILSSAVSDGSLRVAPPSLVREFTTIGFTATEAHAWIQHGFTPLQAAVWRYADWTPPEAVSLLAATGGAPNWYMWMLTGWRPADCIKRAGHGPIRVERYIPDGPVCPDTCSQWLWVTSDERAANPGTRVRALVLNRPELVDVADTYDDVESEFESDGADAVLAAYASIGFSADEASRWLRHGIPAPEAAVWRYGRFSPEEAASLIEVSGDVAWAWNFTAFAPGPASALVGFGNGLHPRDIEFGPKCPNKCAYLKWKAARVVAEGLYW